MSNHQHIFTMNLIQPLSARSSNSSVPALFDAAFRRALLEYFWPFLQGSVETNMMSFPTSKRCARSFSATLDGKKATAAQRSCKFSVADPNERETQICRFTFGSGASRVWRLSAGRRYSPANEGNQV